MTDRELLRVISGAADAVTSRRVREALARDPSLARRFERLDASWRGLELPATAVAPPGFAVRVVAAARAREAVGSPVWVRAAAATALAMGIACGVGLGLVGAEVGSLEPEIGVGTTLAESYLAAAAGWMGDEP